MIDLTVGDLVERLSHLPPDLPVFQIGAPDHERHGEIDILHMGVSVDVVGVRESTEKSSFHQEYFRAMNGHRDKQVIVGVVLE